MDRPIALILMGDWRVPAGHDSQTNEDRGAYRGNDGRSGVFRRSAQEEKIRQREVLRLTERGLMGVPFFGSRFSGRGLKKNRSL